MATMEKVKPPEKIPWVSPVVQNLSENSAKLQSRVKNFFRFREAASGAPASKTEVEDVSEMLTCSPERVAKVLTLCSSPALGERYGLLPETETSFYKLLKAPVPEADDEEGLEVLRVREKITEAVQNDDRYRVDLSTHRRYKQHYIGSVSDLKEPASIKNRRDRGGHVMVKDEKREIVVHVKFYDLKAPSLTAVKVVPRKQKIENCREELIFLGSQPLTAVHEHFNCPKNNVVRVDYSDDPRVFDPKWHMDKYLEKNSCAVLFVHDTLYASTTEAIEKFVIPIQAWAERHADKLKGDDEVTEVGAHGDEKLVFKQALMSEATFSQLTVRFGFPYVYIHGNSCQHVVIFSFARLFHKLDDWKFFSDYPLRWRYRRAFKKLCQICMRQKACWLVTNHPDLPELVNHFCDTCLYCVLYDVTKQPIYGTNKFKVHVQKKGDFSVYRT